MLQLAPPTPDTQVLLLHSPYPGKLKFEGIPSGLLAAISPFAHRAADSGQPEILGLLDPGTATHAFHEEFAKALQSTSLRALCISTSTAAIEETAWAVRTARETRGANLLVVVGGPHEDDCEEKCAQRIAGVDLSIGGECEFALAEILCRFLSQRESPAQFVGVDLDESWFSSEPGGKITLASPWWASIRELRLRPMAPEDLPPPIWTKKRVRFSVLDAPETLPVMISRGCPYGQCTFCSEANRDGFLLRRDFDWLHELASLRPDAGIYFQDSILPKSRPVEHELLPFLKQLGRPWGCQVYLPTLSRSFLEKLAAAGCSYIYTGLESASPSVLLSVGKHNLNPELAIERLGWMAELDLSVGISLMFGAISSRGDLLETEASIKETVRLARRIAELDVSIAGFYPNITTVLPGTELARGLKASGVALDYFKMPSSAAFENFEDGAVGYNFTTISKPGWRDTDALAALVTDAGTNVLPLADRSW